MRSSVARRWPPINSGISGAGPATSSTSGASISSEVLELELLELDEELEDELLEDEDKSDFGASSPIGPPDSEPSSKAAGSGPPPGAIASPSSTASGRGNDAPSEQVLVVIDRGIAAHLRQALPHQGVPRQQALEILSAGTHFPNAVLCQGGTLRLVDDQCV
eukprot:4203874-Pyramimonas_sp.AAC.3